MKMVDLGLQMEAMGGSNVMLNEIAKVLHSEQFIGGRVVQELEEKLAEFSERRFAIACGNGTDALMLALMALKIDRGTVVIPAFGFPAAVEVAILLGCQVAFVDVCPEDGMMDPVRLRSLLRGSQKPKAIIVMDMFGTPAKYYELVNVAAEFGVPLISDAAQSLGASYNGQMSSRWGLMTTTSFFPAKPLGCYGDGGMVFTDDDKLAVSLRELRNHGMGRLKYEHRLVGTNSRLDTLQAAVLLKKLEMFPREIEVRNSLAALLLTILEQAKVPLRPLVPPPHVTSTWACFSLVAESTVARAEFITRLAKNGIPSAVHYPKPLGDQSAYRSRTVYNDGCCVAARRLCGAIFQVPFHPYLTATDLENIVDSLLH